MKQWTALSHSENSVDNKHDPTVDNDNKDNIACSVCRKGCHRISVAKKIHCSNVSCGSTKCTAAHPKRSPSFAINAWTRNLHTRYPAST